MAKIKQIPRVKGMDAIVPDKTPIWQHVEQCVRRAMSSYGYAEVRLPIVEKTELFKRSIGEVTDIVEKEMYTFDDNGESLTLRPEGTAGCVRAMVDKGLIYNQQRRTWYSGAHRLPPKMAPCPLSTRRALDCPLPRRRRTCLLRR